MFSKPLFKQSCKASGTMWSIITVSVCIMLACVMMIAGSENLSMTKNAIQDTVIEGQITSELQKRAFNYYTMSNKALSEFDGYLKAEIKNVENNEDVRNAFAKAYTSALLTGKTQEQATEIAKAAAKEVGAPIAYANAVANMEKYAQNLVDQGGYAEDSAEALEIRGVIFMILNPMIGKDKYMFDDFYTEMGENLPRYDVESLLTSSEDERRAYRENYAGKNSAIFLAGNMIKKDTVDLVVKALSEYGVTQEKYEEFGFNQYSKVKEIGAESIVDFRANFHYRVENMKDGETIESIEKDLSENMSKSLLSSLPKEVAEGLDEIGKADLYGTLVGSIFFKMAGLLLPIIYLIMTANSLIAGQVDSGSMAYVLSSSVKRRTVTFTQSVYLIGSLFLMFCFTTVTSIICLNLVDVDTELTVSKLLLINLGAFMVMFAMSGICFLTSCFFNRSKRSMAIGGGLNMFFLVATMLGLFGSPVLPSFLRMDALNMFNYVSIISFFDVVSILEGTTAFIWKLFVLFGIGIVCYIAGSEKFAKKDLPL